MCLLSSWRQACPSLLATLGIPSAGVVGRPGLGAPPQQAPPQQQPAGVFVGGMQSAAEQQGEHDAVKLLHNQARDFNTF